MSMIMKIPLCVGGVLLVVGSTLVTIAALFQPKDYKGDGKASKSDIWDESIDDV